MSLRVMVVDDSALYRQMVKNILRDIPDVEVVGVASSGLEALNRLPECDPQLLTLDVQMPDMNGLELLKTIKKRRLPVKAIMLSSLTAEGAQVTTDALLAGAFDFIQKPGSFDAKANRTVLQALLTEKLNAFRESIKSKLPRSSRAPTSDTTVTKDFRANTAPKNEQAESKSIVPVSSKKNPVRAVLIGTSTGGPVALREVLPKLPETLNVPVFVVQHMPARYTKSLAERIAETSQLPISEAYDGMVAVPNHVYIAPGGLHLRIVSSGSKVVMKTNDDPPEHNCRPAVDHLFRSATEVYGGDLLAVILTGMGRDGAQGCRIIKNLGGTVFAQHPDGCVVYGMPKVVVEEQLADRVVPLEKIASWIVRTVGA
jgi:two-component system chemotaxis response regulator CheB